MRSSLHAISILLAIIPFTNTIPNNHSTLRFVTAIWRHGDRSATSVWPTDERNVQSSWPQGFGELSTLGIQQQFALGRWLRDRYDGFISERYDKYEIYIRSTDFNRTLMSAQVNLAGMFPPSGDQNWSESIPWQPIPVHTIPRSSEYLFWNDCAKADKFDDEQWCTLPYVSELAKKNKLLFDFLKEKSGMGAKFPGIANMYILKDPLYCQWIHNNDTDVPRVPEWFNDTLRETLFELSDQTLQYYFTLDDILKYRGGPLLHEIVDRMDRRTKSPEQILKYYVYSAHDMSIAGLLGTLGVYTAGMPQPPYASLMLFELHEIKERWIVKTFYRNITEEDPYLLDIAGCPNPCELNDFRARSEHLFVEDWHKACGLVDEQHSEPNEAWYNQYAFHLIILLAAACFIMLLQTVCLVVITRRGKRPQYRTVRTDESHMCDKRGAQ